MGRKSASRSGIRDEQPRSYFPELRNHFIGFFGVKILKFFDADPGSGMEKSVIRDKHPGSATLVSGVSDAGVPGVTGVPALVWLPTMLLASLLLLVYALLPMFLQFLTFLLSLDILLLL
jgi:hypothetical protein